jgi:choline dehydrogenase-like flavoprotein
MSGMKALLFVAVVRSGVAPADRGDRAQLARLKLDGVRITEASAIPAGTGSTDQAENFACR